MTRIAFVATLVFVLGSTWATELPTTEAAPCSDSFEPDDVPFTTAAFIRDGDVQHRNFCEDAVDWVSFAVCAGRTYTIETTNLGDQADTVLELYSPDTTTLLFAMRAYSAFTGG